MLDLIDRFAKSALGRKLAADQAREDLEARRALVDRLKALRDQVTIQLRPLEEAEREAASRVAIAERDLEMAKALAATAQRDRMAAGDDLQRQTSRIERELESSASPAIDAFLRELLDDFDRTRAKYATTGETRNRFGDIVPARSNSESINRRLQGIAEARLAAEALKHEALTEAEVVARIDALRATLPEVSFEEEA